MAETEPSAGSVTARTKGRAWAVVQWAGYVLVGALAAAGGYRYALPHAEIPPATNLVLPWALLTAFVGFLSFVHIQTYVLPWPDELRSYAAGPDGVRWSSRLTVMEIVTMLLGCAAAAALVAITWQGKVSEKLLLLLFAVVPTCAQAGRVWKQRGDLTRLEPGTPRHDALMERLTTYRHQLITPALLAVYVPFVLGAHAIASDEARVFSFCLALLAGLGYVAILRYARTPLAFFISCCGLYAIALIIWLTSRYLDPPEGIVRFASGIHLFGVTLALQIGAFEYLAVVRCGRAKGLIASLPSSGGFGKAARELLPSDVHRVKIALLVALTSYPLAYLAKDATLFLALPGILAVSVTVVLWTSSTRRSASEMKYVAALKLAAYPILVAVAFGFDADPNPEPLSTLIQERDLLALASASFFGGIALVWAERRAGNPVVPPELATTIGATVSLGFISMLLVRILPHFKRPDLAGDTLVRLQTVSLLYVLTAILLVIGATLVLPLRASSEE